MDLLFQVKPTSKLLFFISPIVGSLFVRCAISCFRAWEVGKDFIPLFWLIFIGKGYREDLTKPPIASDQLIGFFIGILELYAYPILLKSENALYIGAWLTFKTVHRLGYSSKHERGSFNRYLLANALILVFSYIIAMCWVDP